MIDPSPAPIVQGSSTHLYRVLAPLDMFQLIHLGLHCTNILKLVHYCRQVNVWHSTEMSSCLSHFRCTWQGGECNISADFPTILTDLGVCYTFNNNDDEKLLNVSEAGERQFHNFTLHNRFN